MEALSIKKPGPSDHELAVRLLALWAQDDNEVNPDFPDAVYLRQLLKRGNFHLWVALYDKQLAGGLSAYEFWMFDKEQRKIFLYELGVTAAYRRRGIARQLINSLKKFCFKQGIKVIFVGTTMDNQAAKQLYQTSGGKLEIAPWYTYDPDSDMIRRNC